LRSTTPATGELIIAQITSRISAPPRLGDYLIQDWQEAKRPVPPWCAPAWPPEASQVVRRLGTLAEADLRGVQAALRGVICQ
jgi:hypothetical protein